MRKCTIGLCLLLMATLSCAQNQPLRRVLPLLQAPERTAAQNQQVLTLFLTSKQPELVFSAGASLVRLPPSRNQEPKLLNVIIKNSDMLKQIFAAVILTAMGTVHPELTELLQQGTTSADTAVRSYAAAAYTILNPHDKQYARDIVQLYIYDAAFAQRAMNLIAANDNQTLHYLKNAANSTQTSLCSAAAAWLADMQSKKATKQLLKMVKTQTHPDTVAAIAMALAKQTDVLPSLVAGLKTDYTSPAAATYALALGFMPGFAIEPIKQSLQEKNLNTRINAARAAAYMAGVLASADAGRYSTDKTFDTQLLKALIPVLSALARQDKQAEPYAENALKQIAKLS